MKQTRKAMRRIALVLVVAVCFTAFTYAVNVWYRSDEILNSAHNIRLSEARKTTVEGTLYDSAGLALAESYTVGERHYIENRAARLALCHTIGDTKGKVASGIQQLYATTLLGLNDKTGAEQTLSSLLGETPVGNDITLTVSAELTAYAASQFPSGSSGALVLINYETGAILAKLSLPVFDPADLPEVETGTYYFDRTVHTPYAYAPGSSFKIVTLAAALENRPGVENETFHCEGVWQPFSGGHVYQCAGGTAHGTVSLKSAFTESCNKTFAYLAYEMGAPALKQTAEAFGFNRDFAFEEIKADASRCLTDDTSSGELLQAGFGQGKTSVTPLHMALISAAIANGGDMMEPRLIRRISRHSGEELYTMTPRVYLHAADAETCRTIAEYMYETVKSGTGTRAKVSGATVCGKTGSAETSNDKSVPTDAWFTGFLYGDDAHPYAIAVVVEKGGSGGSVAAPIAAKVLSKAIEMGLY